jgi:hypothetical protein
MKDGPADAQVHGFAPHVVKLSSQAYGPQAGVNNAGYVKRHAVGALEEHRHDRATATQGKPRCRRFPGWVGDGTLCPIEMSDFTRWKHHQRAAGGEQAHRLPQRRPILCAGPANFERVYQDHVGA